MISRRFISMTLFFGISFLSAQCFGVQKVTARDPTKPAVVDVVSVKGSKKDVSSYKLESIIISPTRQLALINSRFFKVGDKVGTATLAKIDKNSVVLAEEDKNITIYLFDLRQWE